MSNVTRFPIIPHPRPIGMYEDDPRVQAIEELRKAIEKCIAVCGRKAMEDILAEAFRIRNTFGWRARARNNITGDKSHE